MVFEHALQLAGRYIYCIGVKRNWCGSWEIIAPAGEYVFSSVGKREEEARKIFGRNVPLTGNSFLITYDGVVKAGIKDVSKQEVKTDDATREVAITLPRVEILSSHINPDSITVYDQSMNPFNQIEVSDMAQFLAAEEKTAEKNATDRGLLTKAEERVTKIYENQTEAILRGTDKEGYRVSIAWK